MVHLLTTEFLPDLAREVEKQAKNDDDRHARQSPGGAIGGPLRITPSCADEEGEAEGEGEEEIEGPHVGMGRETTSEQRSFFPVVGRDAQPWRPHPAFGIGYEEFSVTADRDAGAMWALREARANSLHERIRVEIRIDFEAWSNARRAHAEIAFFIKRLNLQCTANEIP